MTAEAKKRKIFISAHPADRYEYLDKVCEAIDGTAVCEAVYNPVPSDSGPSIPEDTDTMVVIASVKYFTWSGSGYQSEFFAAVRDGVRVIPILIESGQNAVDLINMRLGKLQFIDATEDLGFALSTLVAHLVNEEREVDRSLPSVFISYRRQDKEYLSSLVKKIKDMGISDSINVWYDEIIAPGENYSKSIMKELDGCDLFILLVTPRILEAGNYVHRVEYRQAKDKKRMLAVEAEKTDKRRLEEMYPDLPRPVNIRQTGAILSVLTEIIATKGPRKA